MVGTAIARLVGKTGPDEPDKPHGTEIRDPAAHEGLAPSQQAASEQAEEQKPAPKRKKPMGMKHRRACLQEAQWEFWNGFPDLLKAAVEGAKKGNAAQLKLLLDLGGLEAGAMAKTLSGKRPKSLATVLLEEMQKEREEAAGREKAAAELANATTHGTANGKDGRHGR